MNSDIIAAIDQERAYQDRKWPNRRHTVGEGLMVLRKVLGDAFRVWGVGGPEADEKALHEVRQVTATGSAIMEHCGVRFREPQDNVNQTDMFDPKSPPDTGVKSEFDIAWPEQKLRLASAIELTQAPLFSAILRPDWRSYRLGPTLLGALDTGEFYFVRVVNVDHTNMASLLTSGTAQILGFYQKYFPDLNENSSVTVVAYEGVKLSA